MSITKKQFAEKLIGTGFLQAVHKHNIEDVKKALDERFIEGTINTLESIYQVDRCILRSKDLVMIRPDGTKCYRDFIGKNTFIEYRGFLLHENIRMYKGDDHKYTMTFINKL